MVCKSFRAKCEVHPATVAIVQASGLLGEHTGANKASLRSKLAQLTLTARPRVDSPWLAHVAIGACVG